MENSLIRSRADALSERLIAFRRDLHMHPEHGFKEFETSKKIIAALSACPGIELETGLVCGTGVIATVRGGKSGPTIMMRADIDCVLAQDKKDAPYRSQTAGWSHSCGHDVHTAVALGTAMILAEARDQLRGTAKIFFQPSEDFPRIPEDRLPIDVYTEYPSFPRAGAIAVEEGILNGVDRLFAYHCWPELKAGLVGFERGAAMGACANIHLAILGKGGHAATPHMTVDPIPVAAQVILALQTIVSRRRNPSETLVLTLGTIRGGTRRSVIGDRVDITGTVRGLDTAYLRDSVGAWLTDLVTGICKANGCEAVVEYAVDQPAVINNPDATKDSVAALRDIMPAGRVVELAGTPMTTEDFAFMAEKVPAVYLKLGTANDDPGTQYALHSPYFDVDERCIATGVAGAVKIVCAYLR